MFRKPKRKAKESFRRKTDDDYDVLTSSFPQSMGNPVDEDEINDNQILIEARKRAKQSALGAGSKATFMLSRPQESSIMHTFGAAKNATALTNVELATSTAHHDVVKVSQTSASDRDDGEAKRGADGIFRDTKRNKFLAGPIRDAQNVRVTARFDYQPDICKDYKDTGFCGYGDTCIYLHDRGDTLTGWQLEQQWEEQQKQKKELQEKELQVFMDQHSGKQSLSDMKNSAILTTEDGLPFACYICREHFKEPVVTVCNHYFCQQCMLSHVKSVNESCPICNKDTYSVFNQPTKLITKKRRILGAEKAKTKDSWQDFYNEFAKNQSI